MGLQTMFEVVRTSQVRILPRLPNVKPNEGMGSLARA